MCCLALKRLSDLSELAIRTIRKKRNNSLMQQSEANTKTQVEWRGGGRCDVGAALHRHGRPPANFPLIR